MQFSTFLVAAFSAVALAQNSFTFPAEIGTIKAGSPFNITWAPSSKTASVSLVLRQSNGDVNNLATVAGIASNLPNTGSYLWTPPSTLPKGSGYAFQIIDDGNKDTNSYSSQFTLDTPTTNRVYGAVAGTTAEPPAATTADTTAPATKSEPPTYSTPSPIPSPTEARNGTMTATRTSTSSRSSRTPTASASALGGTTTPSGAATPLGVGSGGVFALGLGALVALL